jgi:hypothetical protein
MKTYLGDGVYACYDGFHIVLTTEDGRQITNSICLEPNVYESLVLYVATLKETYNGGQESS